MTAKDAISSKIKVLTGSPDDNAAILEASSATAQRVFPVVDSAQRYIGMFELTPGVAYPTVPEPDMLRTSRPVEASAPVSLLLERMASGEKVIAIVADGSPDIYLGAADREGILRVAASLFPQLDEYTELTVLCPPGEYSASAIAHAVEDADAHLLNLNVTAGTTPNSPTTVLLRVNHSRGESVARSLARYGYDTVEMAGTPGMLNTDMIDRVNALLHYLDV